MADYFKDARKAKGARDYLKAGDLYTMGGDLQSAIDAYLQGNHFGHAARLCERDQDYRNAARYYGQAQNFEKSAQLYVNLGDFKKAAEMFEKFGDMSRASEMAQRAGDIGWAAKLADRAEKWERAAELYVKVKNYERAAQILSNELDRFLKDRKDGAFLESTLVRIKKYGNGAGQLYSILQRHEDAARCFEEAENHAKAAESHALCGHDERAAELYAIAEKFAAASTHFERAGKIQKASEMAERAGDAPRAAQLAEQAGQIERAAALYMKSEQPQKAADLLFQVVIKGIEEKAANRFIESHRISLRKAALTAASLYHRCDQPARAGWCYEQAEQFQKAAECYELAKNAQKAGELYVRAGNPTRAYQLLTSAEGGVQKPEALAQACFLLEKYQEAGDLFVLAKNSQRAAEAYARAGNLLKAAVLFEESGDFAQAGAVYTQLKEYHKAAPLLAKGGKLQEAAQMFEQAGQLDDASEAFRSAGDQLGVARTLLRKGDVEDAIALLENFPADHENYLAATTMLGDVFAASGKESTAVQKLQEALKDAAPDSASLKAFYRLATLYEKLGRVAEAREVYEKILSTDPEFRDVPERLHRVQQHASGGSGETSAVEAPPEALVSEDGPQPPPTPAPGAALLPQPDPGLVGKRIREYEILEVLGRGGMGAVYRARHVFLDKERAIKVIESRLATGAFSERFVREARILNELRSPYLVQLHEFGMLDDHQYFMVMELIRGESVKARIKQMGRIPAKESIRIIREAAMGLQCAHEQGIVHRDISPDNLMLVSDSAGVETTKVIDFGIAKPLQEDTEQFTATNMFLGKPEFASPEQCGFLPHGEKIDHRTDIYSLAVTFYTMLTGALPFYSPTPQGYLVKHVTQEPKPLADYIQPAELPESLERVILKAMAKNREDRYASMAEFLRDLETISQ